MELSIVIPVYNECKKIAHDVTAATEFLCSYRLQGEVIVVDDGSTDGAAQAAYQSSVSAMVERRIIRLPKNKGKGAAVRTGILASQGRKVMFADSGHCVDYRHALVGMALIEKERCVIAHASRHRADSLIVIPKPWIRSAGSSIFRQMVKRYLGIPRELTDTQCGFKIYRGDVARTLYRDLKTDGFAFDIEIILLAARRGYKILEFPVEWRRDPDSRVIPWNMARQIFGELYRVKQHIRLDALATGHSTHLKESPLTNNSVHPS